MSGPNPPGPETFGEEPGGDAVGEEHTQDVTTDTGFSQAYSAPESEQFSSGPYVAADPALYDYDAYESAAGPDDQPPTPRWPWVVGVAAILAAVALVASVSLLVFPSLTSHQAAPATTTSKPPPVQDEITKTTPPPPPSEVPPPPPPTETVTGLVHGDYRIGNMLIDGGRVSAILDWELAYMGDVRFDLGYIATDYMAGKHLGTKTDLLGGVAEREWFFAESR